MAVTQSKVGASNFSTNNTELPLRSGNTGELIVQELHGRFYESNIRGSIFSWGKTVTALSGNSITLTASTTPIIGVWNPSTSGVNLVILQAALNCYVNTLVTPVGAGTFVWATSTGNAAITTGSTPWNRKTLLQAGSQSKGFDLSTALTGLTNNIVIFDSGDFQSPTGQTYGTLNGTGGIIPSISGVQNFDGSLIVPPGGVLALLNTTSSTTMSASARILWEEVQIS